MPDEIVDIYDENDELIGNASRAEAQRQGYWIRSFHCWLLDTRSQSIVFQKRSPDKKVHPNKWDISAAGHYTTGEGLADGPRELQEELGIRRTLADLTFLGIRTETAKLGTTLVREFCYTYLLIGDFSPERISPDEVEVSGVSYVPVPDGLNIFGFGGKQIDVDTLIPTTAGWRAQRDVFSADMVIPRKDPYYLKIFIMAERALEGRGPLAI